MRIKTSIENGFQNFLTEKMISTIRKRLICMLKDTCVCMCLWFVVCLHSEEQKNK